MRASFFEFRVAQTGMFTARNNMNVISHNIANARIPGFSRQQTVMQANTPISMANGRGMFGTGSVVTSVVQMRDQFTDRRFWAQNSVLGEFTTKTIHLRRVETMFDITAEDTGMHVAFNELFLRLQELSTSAGDLTYRTNMASVAETLTRMVRNNAEALHQQQRGLNGEVRAIVTEINSLASQIASLNRQIVQFEHDGSNANDLRDQRALLVDRLSELVNVEVQEFDFSAESGLVNDRRFVVQINGHELVNHLHVQTLDLVPRPAEQPLHPMDAPGMYDIQFSSGAPFNIHHRNLRGTLKGLIDLRDGNGRGSAETRPGHVHYPNTLEITTFKGIPFYMERLNELVRVIAGAFNAGVNAHGQRIPNLYLGNGSDPTRLAGHLGAYDLNGHRGLNLFFTLEGGTGHPSDIYLTDDDGNLILDDYNNPILLPGLDGRPLLNALNFTINQNLVDNPRLLGVAETPNSGPSANHLIYALASLGLEQSLFREGRLMDFMGATGAHVAIDLQQATRFRNTYTELTIATINQREAISGVEINEEMLDLLRFNQMFQSSARLITVINEVYDTMINRLGVG